MTQLQHHLKARFQKNQEAVLQELSKIFKDHPDHYNLVISLMSRSRAIKRASIAGTSNHEQQNQDLAQLSQSILEAIDLITPDEAIAYELENSIFQHILVVCKSADREDFMSQLISNQHYKNVRYDISGIPRPTASVNKFDLVIFDNEPHGSREDAHELLRYYLEQTEPYVLYFGKNLPLLWEYPQKAYFANSIFSIHARIQEMISYIKLSSTT